FIRAGSDECIPILDGLTLAEWVEHGHALGWPTDADVLEHLTTLFPPVRPRGFLELRTIDSLGDAEWPAVAETAVSLLLDGPATGQACRCSIPPAHAPTSKRCADERSRSSTAVPRTRMTTASSTTASCTGWSSSTSTSTTRRCWRRSNCPT